MWCLLLASLSLARHPGTSLSQAALTLVPSHRPTWWDYETGMCGQGIGPGGPQKLSGHTEPLSSKGGANEKGGGRKSKELKFSLLRPCWRATQETGYGDQHWLIKKEDISAKTEQKRELQVISEILCIRGKHGMLRSRMPKWRSPSPFVPLGRREKAPTCRLKSPPNSQSPEYLRQSYI